MNDILYLSVESATTYSGPHKDLVTRAGELIKYYLCPENALESVRQAMADGAITGPSLYGNESASCRYSVFVTFNLLLFRDGKHLFYLVQHNMFAEAVYIPAEGVFLSRNDDADRNKRMLHALNQLALKDEEIASIERASRFLGLIKGYSRPGHYFHDRLPPARWFRKALPNLPIVCTDAAFLPASLAVGVNEDLVVKDLNAFTRAHQGFLISSGRASRSSKEARQASIDAATAVHEAVTRTYRAHPFFDAHRPVVWIGLCKEKRSWPEMVEAMASTISAILDRYPSAGFVFDGLTAPIGFTPIQYRPTARSQVETLDKVLREVGRPFDYIDLIAAHASDKIAIAHKVDFFLSSALTDSIWCAMLNHKAGVAYASSAANLALVIHSRTFILPKEYVSDANDTKTNWSEMGYSISPRVIREFTLTGLAAEVARKAAAGDYAPFRCHSSISKVKPSEFEGVSFLCVPPPHEPVCVVSEDGNSDPDDSSRAHPCLSMRYEFLMDWEFEGSLAPELLIVAYDGKGSRLNDTAISTATKVVTFKRKARSFRVFLRIRGRGRMKFRGYRAQPLPPYSAEAGKRETLRGNPPLARPPILVQSLISSLSASALATWTRLARRF